MLHPDNHWESGIRLFSGAIVEWEGLPRNGDILGAFGGSSPRAALDQGPALSPSGVIVRYRRRATGMAGCGAAAGATDNRVVFNRALVASVRSYADHSRVLGG